MRTLGFRAMNTDVLLAAEGSAASEGDLRAARQLIEGFERRFSRFLPKSELSALNRSAGQWSPVSWDMMELISVAADFCRETAGLFDPGILPALEHAGYDRSMTEVRQHGAGTPGPKVPRRMSIAEVELDTEDRRVRMPLGMQLDLGGIAKGWIVDKAAAYLYGAAQACAVSAGGDIVFCGHPIGTAGWELAIEDPRDPARALVNMQLEPGAVATSSVGKRSWRQAGVTRHHIIDPRTQEPAKVDALSVTVLAPHIMEAEVYAKALLISGEGGRRSLAAQRPNLLYFAAWPDGRITTNEMEPELALDLQHAA